MSEQGRVWWQQAIQDASDRIEYLEQELAAVRDLAFRAGPDEHEMHSALVEIHCRASKVVKP